MAQKPKKVHYVCNTRTVQIQVQVPGTPEYQVL